MTGASTEVNIQLSASTEVNIQLNDHNLPNTDNNLSTANNNDILDENENAPSSSLSKFSITSDPGDIGMPGNGDSDTRGRTRLKKIAEGTNTSSDACTSSSRGRNGMLDIQFPDTRRAKSPVTVQEWVAALPDVPGDTDLNQPEPPGSSQDLDTLSLGAEAGCIESGSGRLTTSSVKPHHYQPSQSGFRGNLKRNLLMHSDTNASLNSEHSILSTSSVDSVLQSREADPEEVLRNLGFGYVNSPLARIPSRFFSNKSQARGVDMDTFLRTEEELEERFRSSNLGYRGLVGNSSRRPSEIVEKIIEALRDKEKVERTRRSSNQSWGNVSNSMLSSNIPARFRVMDPNRPTFESIVEQVTHPERCVQPPPPQEPVNTKSFKSLARSVLSPENRDWIQRNEARKIQERKRIYLGGKSFIIDEEGNEIPDSEEVTTTLSSTAAKVSQAAAAVSAVSTTNGNAADDAKNGTSDTRNAVEDREETVDSGATRRPVKKLTHQDSFISITSTLSVDSDWSDDEREELEKMFGAMSERGEEYAKLRQIQRLRRRSRKKGGGSRASGSGAGTPSTISWDGSRLVYSRESSLSDLNPDSINMLQSPALTTTQLSASYGSEEASRSSLHTFREEPESGVFSSHEDATTGNESKSITPAILCNGKNEENGAVGIKNKFAINDNKAAISKKSNDYINEAIDNTYNDTTTVTIKEKLVMKTAEDVNDDTTSQTTVLVEFHEETDEEEIHSDFVNHNSQQK